MSLNADMSCLPAKLGGQEEREEGGNGVGAREEGGKGLGGSREGGREIEGRSGAGGTGITLPWGQGSRRRSSPCTGSDGDGEAEDGEKDESGKRDEDGLTQGDVSR